MSAPPVALPDAIAEESEEEEESEGEEAPVHTIVEHVVAAVQSTSPSANVCPPSPSCPVVPHPSSVPLSLPPPNSPHWRCERKWRGASQIAYSA